MSSNVSLPVGLATVERPRRQKPLGLIQKLSRQVPPGGMDWSSWYTPLCPRFNALVIPAIGSKQMKLGVASGLTGLAAAGCGAASGGAPGAGVWIWLPRPVFSGFGEYTISDR